MYMAMGMSFTGLYGVATKRFWGPLLCGAASGVWACVAFGTEQYPWGLVEVAYCLSNLGIARMWSKNDAV